MRVAVSCPRPVPQENDLNNARLPTGALGTAVYGLKLRDVSLIIIFFNIITCIPPAFIGIGGVQTGMRQMIQARYSFG